MKCVCEQIKQCVQSLDGLSGWVRCRLVWVGEVQAGLVYTNV